MDFTNDATTRFADVEKFFMLLEGHVSKRLKEESRGNK